MTLCDAGPLVALQDRDDPNHRACAAAVESLPAEPLILTWPCLTEAMYLVGRIGGYPAQEGLWGLIESGIITLHETSPTEIRRMHALMAQYRDAPMDLGDASLVTAAETLRIRQVFTLDSHFRAYRIDGKSSFEMIP